MDATSWRRAKELIADVLTARPGDRRAYLAARCPDPSLLREIESLLEHQTADSLDLLLTSDPPPPEAAPVLEPGARVGQYVVVKRLGAGGMGEVFLCHDTALQRDVALKYLTDVAAPGDPRGRLLNEARAAARITHDNVARVYEVVEKDGRAFIVMEYVEGESLAALIRRGALAPALVVSIGRQLAAALTEAHARGIVHRDLKPANVQVKANGLVKVLDFGIAQAIAIASTTSSGGAGSLSALRVNPGTPAYMSPEQLMGGRVDERSDVYSLGVVLYEMATGKRPFSGTDATEMAAVVGAMPPPAHHVRPTVPRALSAVIARAMHYDPDLRFSSAADLGAALEHAAEQRRPWTYAATALAMIVLAVIAFGWRTRSRQAASTVRTPIVAVMPFTSAQEDESVSAGLADVLAADLSTLPGVVVVPRSATVKYAGLNVPLDRVAHELGIDYAITGAVDHQPPGRRVTLNLVDARRNALKATRRFEEGNGALFAVQQEIGDWSNRQLADLAGARSRKSPAPPTRDPAAFEDYAQARRFLDRRDVAGSVDSAIALLTRAVNRDPRFALAHAGLGEAFWAKYEMTRDPAIAQRAKDATLEALRLDPQQPLVRLALAHIYSGTGRLGEAVEELQQAIAQQPSSDELHRFLGRVYGDQGDVEKAGAEFMQAIRLRPGFWDTYRQLGLTFYQAGRYPDAIAAFTRVTELQPDSAVGFSMLGTAYHASGDLPHALENYERANAITPSPTAWSNIGTIHYHDGKFAAAAAAYQMSIKLQPKEPSTYRNLADALTRAHDTAGARNAYRQAVAVADARLSVEHDGDILALKALCLAKLRDFTQADDAIREAIRANATASVLYHEAIVRTLENRRQDALISLRSAIQKGYSRDFARDDDELTPLRDSQEFLQIVGEPQRKEEGP